MSDLLTCIIAVAIYFAIILVTGIITWLQMKAEDQRKKVAQDACKTSRNTADTASLLARPTA